MENLVLVNRTISPAAKQQAEILAGQLGIETQILCFEHNRVTNPIPKEVRTTIVFGGDGSVKAVMEKLLQRDDPGLLVVTKSGSQHGAFNAAKNEAPALSPAQLLSADLP